MSAPPPAYSASAAYPGSGENREGQATGYGAPGQPATNQYGVGASTYGAAQPAYGAPAPIPVAPAPQPAYGAGGYGAGGGYGGEPGPGAPLMMDHGPAETTTVDWGNSFSDRAVRHAFIKKVYLILTLQLVVTAAFVAVFVLVEPVRIWVQANIWFYILAYVLFLALYITLVCCRGVRQSYPGNFIALAIFTLAFSYMCAAIASYHNAEAVLIAAGITLGVTVAISVFAIQTKIDFTMCHGLMFAASMTLLFAGLAFLIISLAIPNADTRTHYILQCVYGSIAALVLALFLVFDTQRVVGGKRKNALSPEEYIVGALELYLDIVYLFLIILSFFGGGSKD